MSSNQNKKTMQENTELVVEPEKQALTCGIIMPIATMTPEYQESHWIDIRHILDTAIKKAGFTPRIVSESEDSTIIHKSIINNLYNDPIIVCDVSNKNANVMFELGMRLAFNKPVVIVKDDKTGYSFDTSNIQHLEYRKDLRHHTVEKFIEDLAKKIKATCEAPKKEDYQSFLSHFGKFEVATIENKPIAESEAIQKVLEKVTTLETKINNMNSTPVSLKKSERIFIKSPPVKDMTDLINLVNVINEKIDDFGEVTNFTKNALEINLNPELSYETRNSIKNDINKILDGWDLPF